jgi:hypothetical protein
VTKDYTTALRLDSSTGSPPLEKLENGNTRVNFAGHTFFRSYSDLQNTLVGYYGLFNNQCAIKNDAGVVLKSAYLSGNNLVILFKKFAATSGKDLSEVRFAVIW